MNRHEPRTDIPTGSKSPSRTSMRSLVRVWACLMVLLTATAASSLVSLGVGNIILNIVIAIAKAVLVVQFFMHLRYGIPLLRQIAIVGLFTLSLLFILSGADFIARNIERSVWQEGADTHQQSMAAPVTAISDEVCAAKASRARDPVDIC